MMTRLPTQRVTLEMSLKPFFDLRPDAIRAVCRTVFQQWEPLHRYAGTIAVLLWTADGSEILDYTGRLEDRFEWANLIGIANPHGNAHNDPAGVSLHSRSYPYRPDAPDFTYRDLQNVVRTLRDVGRETTGKTIEIGATFDPGGEFARSSFKYERHPEICMAHTMGHKTFVCCYATLNADTRAYATFPNGIPQDTSLGEFLGRQAKAFLGDLGFDYLWLSNGFGFGLETWRPTGPLFDGVAFDGNAAPGIREKILRFWRDLRAGLGEFPVEVRGTNLGTGADLATDAVPLREIMDGDFGIRATAPNSPWAAINGDFGVELAGYMGRIAQPVKGQQFAYRFYAHDPWWVNSPWIDRYGRQPHDIYLPLSVGRIDADGSAQTSESVAILTIDDSYGQMPDDVPNEIIPHLLRAQSTAPDAPGLITWIYPYDRFHDDATDQPAQLAEAFFHDWFIRNAVNDGFAVNTVVADRNFASSRAAKPDLYRHTILLSRVPDAGSALERALLDHLTAGGRVLLFGPVTHASNAMLGAIGVERSDSIDGELTLSRDVSVDQGPQPDRLIHRALLCGGGIDTVLGRGSSARALATVADDRGNQRVVATQAGTLAWVRGSLSSGFRSPNGGLENDDPATVAAGASLLRDALASLGLRIGTIRRSSAQRQPVLTIHRSNGAMWFSGYMPDTTVGLELATADGVPVLVGADVELHSGRGRYRFPIAWRHECRVLIEQSNGVVQCREGVSVMVGVSRRLVLSGLDSATVRFLPEPGSESRVAIQSNSIYPHQIDPKLDWVREDRASGVCLTVRGVSGSLHISW